MKKGMKILAVVAVVVLIAGTVYAAKDYVIPTTWRYKITVEIETPEGLKSGSAVREVSVSYGPTIGDIPTTSVKVKGEAVVVDLGKRGILFSTVDGYDLVFRAFPFGKGGLTREGIEYYSHLKNVKASVLGIKNMIPQLVTFKDVNEPMTVKSVDINNLSSTFGEGVTLKDITIETTDEPMTSSIDEVLPWLDGLKGGYLDGGFTSRNAPLGLHAGNFRTGAGK